MEVNHEPHYRIKHVRIVLQEISEALIGKDMNFPELFENYEQYHLEVNTGNLYLANLFADWIESDIMF